MGWANPECDQMVLYLQNQALISTTGNFEDHAVSNQKMAPTVIRNLA